MNYFKKDGLIQPESDIPYQLLVKTRNSQKTEEKLNNLETQIAELKKLIQQSSSLIRVS